MKMLLMITCSSILAALLFATALAFAQQDILSAVFQLWPYIWFRATLLDLYCGLLFFYLWIAWHEPSWSTRILWLVLVLCLGNIATSSYLLLQLRKWNHERGMARLFEPSIR